MGYGAGQGALKDAETKKTIASLADAVSGISDSMTLMIGGLGGSGAPIELIHALIDRFRATGSPRNLTVTNNNAGNGHVGLAALIEYGMVNTLICSLLTSVDPVVFNQLYLAGKIELELVPQGTLAERIRFSRSRYRTCQGATIGGDMRINFSQPPAVVKY
jgi:3-oxoadipate CoA-transferase, alpha subunit